MSEVSRLAAESWIGSLLLSSAFANSAGISAVAPALSSVASITRVFVGIRNGSTTAQAVAKLLSLGVELYGVDTASRGRIFHPKIHIASGIDRARCIVGSANLTHAGLHNNLEAGADISLDLTDTQDRDFVDRFLDGFADLVVNHPRHCFRITSGRQIVDLMRQGLLEDERRPRVQAVLGAGVQGPQTSKPPISLPQVKSPTRGTKRRRRPISPPSGGNGGAPPSLGRVVWMKPKLPMSDLQLNNASSVPGVLRLTQAGYRLNGQVIDQTIYFRYGVFNSLTWQMISGKEVADVPVSLVIAGVHVGHFGLRLRHKAAWASNQGNYTTVLHWDGATPHIKQQGNLNRSLKLREPVGSGGRFVIEID